MTQSELHEIGDYYGGLRVKEEEGKYYWGIENFDGTFYEEISKELYDCLLKHNEQSIEKSEGE